MEYSHVSSSRDHRRRRGRPLPTPLAERLEGHLATFATHLREGLLAASTAVGLDILDELMGAEVAALAGPKGKHQAGRAAYRHGSDAGTVTLGGRRLAVRRPRVRSADRSTELALASYEAASATDLLAEGIVARMLAGLSSRRYGAGLEPVGRALEERATGTSHAAVSRRFVAATAERLASFLARPLAGQRFLVVMLDGFGMGDHLLLAALGIRADGTKVPLGVVEGSVENQAIVLALLADLRDRGLDASAGLLFVVDGGSGIGAGLRSLFGQTVLVHRCRRHKERNVLARLPFDRAAAGAASTAGGLGRARPGPRQGAPRRPRPEPRPPAAGRGCVAPRGPDRDAHPHPARGHRRAAPDAGVDQPDGVDDRDRPRPRPPSEALGVRRDGAALGGRRDARRRVPVPPGQGLRAAAGARARARHPGRC
ncbi:MAG: transposase [Candidatus Limnocylindrales bacterium]